MTSFTGLTELEDLRLFLQERAQEFDSTIDTTLGSTFDTEIIQPLIQRLGPDPYNTPIRTFILKRIKNEFPDLVVGDGEPIDDLVVKINQILLEPYRRQIKQISNNQSLANPSSLNEREADNLGANFFVRRQLGGLSVGLARLYYSAPQFTLVTPSNPVADGNGLRFFPVENQSITADRMLFNQEDGLFFFDIVVRAEAEGSNYDIEPNTLVSIEGVPAVVKVANKSSFTEGGDKETTEAFIERVETSLTEKSLVTVRGINARLTDVFESVRLIQVIGFGDPEMNRDIITGASETLSYAVFSGLRVAADTIDISPPGTFTDGIPGHNGFFSGGVDPGDIISLIDYVTDDIQEYTVEKVLSATSVEVSPATVPAGTFTMLLRRAAGKITISDIPGGILQPTTQAGTIEVTDGEVHIGGALDVFVRAAEPQQRDITLEGILDGAPLHFGLDLESFGGDDVGHRAHITTELTSRASVPDEDRFGNSLATLDEIVVEQYDSGGGTVPWKPSEEDVDRFVQLVGGVQGDFGTFKILEVIGEEYFLDHSSIYHRVVRIKIDVVTELESGSTVGPFLTHTAGANQGNFDLNVRLLEEVTTKGRVRDRDGTSTVVAADDPNPGEPEIVGGINYGNLPNGAAAIGDSVVIETGDDAGIYSVRRILSWLNNNDTLILDRDLTATVTPSGSGGGTGLRYRIADELNVDLIAPKVAKIPLGSIFAGDDLSSVAGNPTVSVSGSTNFLLAGVEVGDTLEIFEGDNKGAFGIIAVTGTTATLDANVPNTGFAQNFSVYRAFSGVSRPMVRVKEIELLDSSSQPTGIKVPYGDVIDARVSGILSNREQGNVFERFTGTLDANGVDLIGGGGIDYGLEGVEEGYRLNIKSGQSIGTYTIKYLGPNIPVGEGGPLGVDVLRVHPAIEGGQEFSVAETDVNYSVGLPSSGFVRLHFLEPTSVEILTGLNGGRLQFEESGTPKEFRFSETNGFAIVPAGGSDESNPRDLRVVRNFSVGGGDFNSILEFTDEARPGVFELEIQEGDTLEVNEQIPFRATGGSTFAALGIFGSPSGLRTISGSNQVSVPDTSKIDFDEMDSAFPLAGQKLFIDSGPDTGEYTIEEVVNDKTLRLDKIMTGTTSSILSKEAPGTFRDSSLAAGVPGKTNLEDLTDGGALEFGAQVGHFVTIFESTRGDIDGTYEVSDILTGTPDTLEIDADITQPSVQPDPFTIGEFTWVRTGDDILIEQEFRIYRTIPKELSVVQVATKRTDEPVVGPRRADLSTVGPDRVKLIDQDAGFSIGAEQGDLVEILSGPSAGVYTLDRDSGFGALGNNEAQIHPNPEFPVTLSDVPYRIWSGLHGSRRMVTVGPKDSSDGRLDVGTQMPYRLLRPKTIRVSSTEMQDNFDGSLYFVDVQVESQGSGDDLNLDQETRLVVKSGLVADGYTYSVDNENLSYSVFEQVSLNFDRRFLPLGNSDSPENFTEISGRNLSVTYETSTPTRLVNDLMRSDQERPINASPIARHFLPSFLFTSFFYAGGATEQDVGEEMEDFINGLGAEDEIQVSDLEAFLTRRGATFVRHPIELVTVTHDLGRKLVVNRSGNKLGGLNDVPFNGTGRISAFFTALGETLILERES